jgi:O-antigen/teichoic acid export membrane protein
VRLLALIAYRQSAYKAFPLLHIRWRHVRRMRLQEATAFSIFLFVIDLANKINMTSDAIVIGAFVSTAAVAVWSVVSRLTDTAGQMTSVLTRVLFPTVAHHATRNEIEGLRMVMMEGTRISVATVLPLLVAICALCGPLVPAWVGPRFAGRPRVVPGPDPDSPRQNSSPLSTS